jgi:hypothetical protein
MTLPAELDSENALLAPSDVGVCSLSAELLSSPLDALLELAVAVPLLVPVPGWQMLMSPIGLVVHCSPSGQSEGWSQSCTPPVQAGSHVAEPLSPPEREAQQTSPPVQLSEPVHVSVAPPEQVSPSAMQLAPCWVTQHDCVSLSQVTKPHGTWVEPGPLLLAAVDSDVASDPLAVEGVSVVTEVNEKLVSVLPPVVSVTETLVTLTSLEEPMTVVVVPEKVSVVEPTMVPLVPDEPMVSVVVMAEEVGGEDASGGPMMMMTPVSSPASRPPGITLVVVKPAVEAVVVARPAEPVATTDPSGEIVFPPSAKRPALSPSTCPPQPVASSPATVDERSRRNGKRARKAMGDEPQAWFSRGASSRSMARAPFSVKSSLRTNVDPERINQSAGWSTANRTGTRGARRAAQGAGRTSGGDALRGCRRVERRHPTR